MATSQTIQSNQLVDSAIGAINVQNSLIVGYDIDDFVTSTVKSLAVTIQIYNKASNVNPKFTTNRRIVSIAGVTVGGY
jgi:hypothetical protein